MTSTKVDVIDSLFSGIEVLKNSVVSIFLFVVYLFSKREELYIAELNKILEVVIILLSPQIKILLGNLQHSYVAFGFVMILSLL